MREVRAALDWQSELLSPVKPRVLFSALGERHAEQIARIAEEYNIPLAIHPHGPGSTCFAPSIVVANGMHVDAIGARPAIADSDFTTALDRALLPFSSWLPRAMEGPTPSSAGGGPFPRQPRDHVTWSVQCSDERRGRFPRLP